MKKRTYNFETANAQYYLYPGLGDEITHIRGLKHEDLDAIVENSGNIRYEDIELSSILKHKEQLDSSKYDFIIRNYKMEKPAPIFFVDIPNKISRIIDKLEDYEYSLRSRQDMDLKEINRIENTAYLGLGIAAAGLITTPILYGALLLTAPYLALTSSAFRGKNNTYDNIHSYLTAAALFHTPFGYRSAMSAKKIEEFIVPELLKKNKIETDQKPKILLNFGMGNSDIKPYLQHKSLRDATIYFHQKILKNKRINDCRYENKVASLTPTKIIHQNIISSEYDEEFEIYKTIYRIKSSNPDISNQKNTNTAHSQTKKETKEITKKIQEPEFT